MKARERKASEPAEAEAPEPVTTATPAEAIDATPVAPSGDASRLASSSPRRRHQADRATPATIQRRVQAVLQIRLDGAEGWDVRQYVAEKQAAGEAPWTVDEGGKQLSERQIRRYVEQADALIAESCRTSRKRALRRHMAQRRNLYARAVQAGDLRTALAVLTDLAKLQGLYPADRVEATHTETGRLVIEEIVVGPDRQTA
jgi:hypothetical protein